MKRQGEPSDGDAGVTPMKGESSGRRTGQEELHTSF